MVCVTAPHQTINQDYPKPHNPHATQPDSTVYYFRWRGLGSTLSSFVVTLVRTQI